MFLINNQYIFIYMYRYTYINESKIDSFMPEVTYLAVPIGG